MKGKVGMTLPDERTRAVNNVRKFLRMMLDPKETPGIPKKYRLMVRSLLKHYPSSFEMNRIAEKAPEFFGELND